MDINNLLVNMTKNNFQLNGNQNTKVNNQNSFLNMLNVVMQNESTTNEILNIGSFNFDGDIINNQIPMMDSSISNADIIDLMQNQDDKSSSTTEIDYNNLMSMLLSMTQSIAYPEMQNLNPEEIINIRAQGIQQVSNLENLVSSRNIENNFNNSKELPATSVNNLFDKTTIIANNNNNSNNDFITTEGTDIKQENVGFKHIISDIENENFTSSIDSKLNSLKEVVVNNENVGEKDDSNVDVDFSRGIVENKDAIFTNNKIGEIIQVSDESSKLKTTVLSQVEDKIILMSNDKKSVQEVTMELFPNNLGKVNIKMSIEAEKITVEIMALNEKTGNILMSNAGELTKILQNNFDNGTIHVTVTENSLNQYNQSNSNYNQQQSEKEQNYKNQIINKQIADANEDNNITEMINLRNLKLNKVV